jgi:hypothetical protein
MPQEGAFGHSLAQLLSKAKFLKAKIKYKGTGTEVPKIPRRDENE